MTSTGTDSGMGSPFTTSFKCPRVAQPVNDRDHRAFALSKPAFANVLGILQPKAVLVLGKSLWNHLLAVEGCTVPVAGTAPLDSCVWKPGEYGGR